jgi:hypothetical protein
MSQLNVDVITNKVGTGGPLFPNGISVSGTLTGTASTATLATTATVAQNLTGSPSITVSGVNNSGITTVSTLKANNGFISVGSTLKVTGFTETQSTVSIAGTVLTLDGGSGTVFTHTTSANIGVVSFTGVSTASAGSQTFSVLITQGATPYNTTAATGIGTALARVVSTGSVGYSTHVKVGGGSTITLTGTAGALDLLTFIVSYDGTIPPVNSSFKVVGFAATDFRNAVV